MKKLLTCLFSLMMAVAILSPVTMSAEEETYRIHIKVSELDQKDGVRINSTYRNGTKRHNGDASLVKFDAFFDAEDVQKIIQDGNNLFDYSENSVVRKAGENKWNNATWIATSGNMYVDEGTGITFVKDHSLWTKYNDVTIEISFNIDEVGADNYGPDKVDDRNQVTYPVKYETYPGSGLFKTASESYTVNKGDDIAKLVTSGEYTELPLYEEVEYDKDDNEYVLQYEIKEDVIVAKWVKEGSARFVNQVKEEPKYDELDANKDGVVSCEEALGKGWVWNNETSACELKGSSNTGSYVPNTATK